MNRILIACCAALSSSAFAQTSHAQWSVNGVKIFYNAGNVGIGTNDPLYALDVRSAGQRAIFGLASTGAGANYGVFGQSMSTGGRGVFGMASTGAGANYGVLGQSNSTHGFGVYGLAIAAAGINYGVYGRTNSATGYAGYFFGGRNYFHGNVGVGIPNPVAKLDVLQSNTMSPALNVRTTATRVITAYGNGALVLGPVDAIAGVSLTADTLGGPTAVIGHQVGGTNIARIRMSNSNLTLNGNVGIGVSPAFQLHLSQNSAAKPTANTWTITSDRRLKKNIQTIDNALGQLMKLRGVTYQWIDPSTQGDMTGTYTGFIAQEVEEVFPEWVNADADGIKRLTVIGFEGLAVEALRQLREDKDREIAVLRNDNAIQQNTIHDLANRLTALESKVYSLENQPRR